MYARCDPLSKTKNREQFLYCQAFGRMEAQDKNAMKRGYYNKSRDLGLLHSRRLAQHDVGPPAEGVAIKEEDSHTRAAAVEG